MLHLHTMSYFTWTKCSHLSKPGNAIFFYLIKLWTEPNLTDWITFLQGLQQQQLYKCQSERKPGTRFSFFFLVGKWKKYSPAHQNVSWHIPEPQMLLLAAAVYCWCWKKWQNNGKLLGQSEHKTGAFRALLLSMRTCRYYLKRKTRQRDTVWKTWHGCINPNHRKCQQRLLCCLMKLINTLPLTKSQLSLTLRNVLYPWS